MHLRKVWEDLNASLWFRPLLWVIGSSALAIILISIDRRLAPSEQPLASLAWFFTSGADGARAMLTAIATTMFTATTLAFSIVMVAVVQTANAYSPRILPQYLGDRANQHVLGILVSTFVYSLLVLRAVQSTDDVNFVPPLAVNVGLLLAVLATGAFIYFINHATHSISVSNVILLTLNETERLVEKDKLFPENLGVPWAEDNPPPQPAGPGATLTAEKGGYVQYVETVALLKETVKRNAVLRLELAVGDYVLPGRPLATVWPATALDDELQQRLRREIHLDKQRSLVQDVLFGVHQLADVAVRALSPGINDPSTALHCVDVLALLLAQMIEHGPVSPYRCDEAGQLRVVAPSPTFAQMLDAAFTQIRRYGGGDIATTLRLLHVLGELGELTRRSAECEALWQAVVDLMATADRHLQPAGDRETVNERFLETAAAFDENPHPHLLS